MKYTIKFNGIEKQVSGETSQQINAQLYDMWVKAGEPADAVVYDENGDEVNDWDILYGLYVGDDQDAYDWYRDYDSAVNAANELVAKKHREKEAIMIFLARTRGLESPYQLSNDESIIRGWDESYFNN